MVELLVLHAKFQNHWPSGSEEEDCLKFFFLLFSHCNHLGHVTLTIYANFDSPLLRMLQIKLALIGQTVLEKKMFEYYGHKE